MILVHEWGHFFVARKLGIRVEEFSIGFGPKIVSRLYQGIRYSLRAIPLGGFVKIFGERGEGEEFPDSFASRPIWQRALVLGSGVIMNLVLAWVLFTGSAALGIPVIDEASKEGHPVSVVEILPGSPAEQAGIRFGDMILEMRREQVSLRIESEKDVRDFDDAYRGEEVTLLIKRGSKIFELQAVPRVNFPEGEGPLGVRLSRFAVLQVKWYLSPIEGFRVLWLVLSGTVAGLGSLLKQIFTQGPQNIPVSGPVGIFFFAYDVSVLGLVYFLRFLGIISASLAILNILPIPVLDGGWIFFLIIEKIKGSRVSKKMEQIALTAGVFFLSFIMIFATYQDILKNKGRIWESITKSVDEIL